VRHPSASSRLCVLALAATVGLACRPAATPAPKPPPTVEPTTGEPAAATTPEPAAEPEQLPPHRCNITMDLLAPGGVTGRGSSAQSSEKAKDKAWAQACEQLEKEQGLDCHAESVAIRQEGTGTIQSKKGSGEIQQSYRHTVTLTTQRRATGYGESTEDRHHACRAAKEDACQKLSEDPCSSDDIRVIEVDGGPPGAQPERAPAPPSRTM